MPLGAPAMPSDTGDDGGGQAGTGKTPWRAPRSAVSTIELVAIPFVSFLVLSKGHTLATGATRPRHRAKMYFGCSTCPAKMRWFIWTLSIIAAAGARVEELGWQAGTVAPGGHLPAFRRSTGRERPQKSLKTKTVTKCNPE